MMNILILDSDSSIQETLEMFFREKGHAVVTCSSGREALAWRDRASPDVAIVDSGLPDIDGMDLLDCLRAVFPETRVLVIIPQGDEEAWKEAEKRGAWGWIEEPLDVEDLECGLDQVTRPATACSRESGAERGL